MNLCWRSGWVQLLSLSCLLLSACNGGSDQIKEGGELYATYCTICHGNLGQGYVADAANALNNQDFLAVASDSFILTGIGRGRPGTPMSAWSVDRGGPLDTEQLLAMTAFIRNWQEAPSVDLNTVVVGSGEPLRGQALYAVYCADCHGEEGQGGTFMSVANAEFLATASDAYLRHVIAEGRSGTPMIAYANTLTNQGLDDLVALIRSWQKPIDDEPFTLPSKDLGDPLINPEGAEPGFDPEGLYVSVAELKEAFDEGASLVVADARPPLDYVGGHISGAVSVPFYEAETFIPQLPKDKWIVTYCACPHAESEQSAKVLLNNGFGKVKVLDEGLPLWQELGYPITEGPTP